MVGHRHPLPEVRAVCSTGTKANAKHLILPMCGKKAVGILYHKQQSLVNHSCVKHTYVQQEYQVKTLFIYLHFILDKKSE